MNHVRFSRLHLPSVVLSVFSASVGFALSSRIKKVKKNELCSVENNFQLMIRYHKAVTFLSWPVCLIYEHPSESQHKHSN